MPSLTRFTLVLLMAISGRCASLRCPTAAAGAGFSETGEFTVLWRALSMPGADGSDGPLGCPLDVKLSASDPGSPWTGVQQRFQRGVILIGNGASTGMEVAAVRGLGG